MKAKRSESLKKQAEKREYHYSEARRIRQELDNLGPGFAKSGIVRTVLKERIAQELGRGNLNFEEGGE